MWMVSFKINCIPPPPPSLELPQRAAFVFPFCFRFCSLISFSVLFFSVITGTGPKRVYQFKLIEKEPWGQEPKQLAKLGSVDLKVIKFLRKEIADRVASKF